MPSRRSNRRRAAQRSGLVNTIPPIMANPTNSVSCRYYGTATVITNTEFLQSISVPDLQRAPGVIAMTSSTAAAYAQAIRIRRVSLWVSPVTTSIPMAPVTAGIVWYNNTGRTNQQVVSDTSINPLAPAYVSAAPPKNSFCDLWYSNSSDTMFDFVITGPSATLTIIIQVDLDWVASNQSNGPVSATFANTLTPGATYYPPLDGVSTHQFLRQGLPSAF